MIKRIVKIMRSIFIAALISVTVIVPTAAKVNFEPYRIKESSITRVEKQILIYHTHTCEEYEDFTIVEAGEDLAKKLEDKGYKVTHVKENFSKDYNNSYNSSREYLNSIDLSNYSLIIDYHRNSLEDSNTTQIWGVDNARVMFVYSKDSLNYESSKTLGKAISDNLEGNLYMRDYEYNHGINNFNADLNENMILIESGNDKNDKWEIKRLNTHLSNSIDKALKG